MAKRSIAGTFTAHARDYDAPRRRLVPCFDAFYGAALDRIADWGMPPQARVLDLGAGTGLMAAHGQGALAHGRRSPRGRQRGHAGRGPRPGCRARPAPASRSPTTRPHRSATAWDLVVSALSIHHLEDAAKRALFARIRDALRPGGLFVNAEQVLGPTPAAEAAYAARWRAEVQGLGATPGEIVAAEERMRFDRCAPLELQLDWLRDAGFAEVDCVFKAWRFAVYAGRAAGLRPSSTVR